MELGQNVSVTVSGSKLTIEVDLAVNLGPSSSGKSIMIASTGGNVPCSVPGSKPVSIGLNIYRKA